MEDALSENGKGHRKLPLVTLVIVNFLVITGAVGAYFMLQQPARAKLKLDNFSWYNHSSDVVINTSYVLVQGSIRNLELQDH